MTGWQVWGWALVLLGPPALFGAAVAFESWRDHWRPRRAVRLARARYVIASRTRHPSFVAPEDRPEWGRL